MSHGILLQLTAILVMGILAQWIAWRVRLPSILFLLTTGVLAGPVTGWLHPDKLFGDLMLPVVSLSVAVILYEGGLNLKFRELRNIGVVFTLLTTVGAAISWTTGTLAARFILRFDWQVAALLGAILVVTGPTVIGPILRHLRLRGRVGALLKWEGIIIDPLGATLAVLVFTVAQAGALREGFSAAAMDLGLTLVLGIASGVVAAAVLTFVLRHYLLPDTLHNPISLMLMLIAFMTTNLVQEESGLLAVTVMGIVMANQKWVSIHHVIEFKETLTVLLISSLFIILAASLQPQDLLGLGWQSFAFVAVLVFVARPVSVLVSTWRSALTWQERCLLCCMAPRGIVAAAISSVFALSLVALGYQQAIDIVPVTFLVVFATVLLYGLTAGPLARWLGLIERNPQGVLFVGGESWVRTLALALKDEEIPVLIIDTGWDNIRSCRMAGLPCLHGSALAEETREEVNYTGLGRMLAVTSNNEVNSLACMRFREDFGRHAVYQLPFSTTEEQRHHAVSNEHRGRFLFGADLNFTAISEWGGHAPKVKKTKLTAEFDYAAFRAEHGDTVLPLLFIRSDRSVVVRTAPDGQIPKAGDTIISLVHSLSSKWQSAPTVDSGDTVTTTT